MISLLTIKTSKLTSINLPDLLKASHIKFWSKSTDIKQLDVNNDGYEFDWFY